MEFEEKKKIVKKFSFLPLMYSILGLMSSAKQRGDMPCFLGVLQWNNIKKSNHIQVSSQKDWFT